MFFGCSVCSSSLPTRSEGSRPQDSEELLVQMLYSSEGSRRRLLAFTGLDRPYPSFINDVLSPSTLRGLSELGDPGRWSLSSDASARQCNAHGTAVLPGCLECLLCRQCNAHGTAVLPGC